MDEDMKAMGLALAEAEREKRERPSGVSVEQIERVASSAAEVPIETFVETLRARPELYEPIRAISDRLRAALDRYVDSIGHAN
jgi:hypothetical protein